MRRFRNGISETLNTSLAHVAQRVPALLPKLSRTAVTLKEVDTYAGRPLRGLFPAPHRVPEVQVQERWRLRGLVSEDLAFPSLHVPLEARFQRRYREQYAATHTVYARRIRPAQAGRRPRLLYLHGYMQPETYVEEVALLSSMALGR
jgi:hypothetical protein